MPASTLIISRHSPAASGFRQMLAQLGWECPYANVVSLETAAVKIAQQPVPPRYVFLVCPDPADDVPAEVSLVRSWSDARLIVIGRMDDPRNVLDAVHQGADDYLDQERDLPAQLKTCLERLRRKDQSAPGAGRMLAVISPSGGSGASLVAANLAAALAQRGGSSGCVLLDLDPRHGDQASLFNLTPRHTLADLCRNIESLDRNMLEQSLTPHSSGVRVLAAADDLEESSRIDGRALLRIAQQTRLAFPLTVLDLPTALDEHHIDVLSLCDAVVVVFRLDFPSLRNLRRCLQFLEHKDIDERKVRLVANRCGLPMGLCASKIRSALRRDILLSIDDDPEAANLTVNCGTPAVLEMPRSPLALTMRKLADLVVPTTTGVAPAAVVAPSGSSSAALLDFVRSRFLSSDRGTPALTD